MKAAKWLGIAALALIGLVAAGLLIGLTAEQVAERRDKSLYPPPGRMADTGNGRRHMFCEGKAAPTVILITGMGIPSVLVRPLQDQVAGFSRVCAYDRAGLGWSEPAVRPLNVIDQAAELHQILAANGESGPFVMVGHSYGGLVARDYAKENPRAVAGMVLVDSAGESDVFQARFLQGLVVNARQNAQSERLARIGFLRALIAVDPSVASYSPHLAEAERREANALILRPAFYRGAAFEMVHAFENVPAAMQKTEGFGTLGSLPLVVIRHGQPFTGPEAWMEERWTKTQLGLAALSSDSRLITATKDGHNIIIDNPGLVASAIHDVVAAVRGGRTLKPECFPSGSGQPEEARGGC